MRAESNKRPPERFRIEALRPVSGAPCTVIFYDNVTGPAERQGPAGETEEVYAYDTYHLSATWAPGLEARVENGFEAWLEKAKAEEAAAEAAANEPSDAEKIANLQGRVEEMEAENILLNSVLETLVIESLE